MKKKLTAFVALAVLVICCLAGCGSQSANSSEEATAEHPMVLALSHSLNESHSVHQALLEFANNVEERTDGRIQIKIYPNGQLGSESEGLEQVMSGVLAMTRVGAPSLATYNDAYHTFGLPYVFQDENDFYNKMNSQEMEDFFLSSPEDGFVALTYYTSGSRSFYTIDKPIRTPEDLKGLKIRVQDMKSQTDMVKAMGGTPVAMSYGEVYTALQTGIIDGSENNETALVTGRHGEVCKVYSTDQHAMIPDILVISTEVWNKIAEDDQKIILESARESTQSHNAVWNSEVEKACKEAEESMGVTFINDIDKAAFQEATAGMREEYAEEYPGVKNMLELLDSIE